MILNILNDDDEKCKMIQLRALFFASEDRQQIAKLIVETLKRLSVASGDTSSAKDLWEKIYGIMTNAVTKKLFLLGIKLQRCSILTINLTTSFAHHILVKS